MVRVHINDVTPETPTGYRLSGNRQACRLLKTAEACSHKDTLFIDMADFNPLIAVAYNSFAHHIPMVITPDTVWNTIMQGVSQHVNMHKERFRVHFARHFGKREIKVIDDALIPGSWENKWDLAIELIRAKLLKDIPDKTRPALDVSFTTSGLAESTAHAATFMDIVKEYYTYKVTTMCGIPWVDIAGTIEDWQKIGKLIDPLLNSLGLHRWNRELQHILREIISAFNENINRDHWNSMFNYHGPRGSGGVAMVSGWLGMLFLYISDGINPMIEGVMHTDHVVKIPLYKFPVGLSNTPFTWQISGENKAMSLISGLIGVTVNDDGALLPVVGWVIGAVTHDTSICKSVDPPVDTKPREPILASTSTSTSASASASALALTSELTSETIKVPETIDPIKPPEPIEEPEPCTIEESETVVSLTILQRIINFISRWIFNL